MNPHLIAHDQLRRTIFYPKTDVAHDAALYPALRSTLDQSLHEHLPIIHDICLSRWGCLPAHITPIAPGGTFHLLYKISVNNQLYVIRLNRLKEFRVAWEFLIDAWVYPKLASLGLPGPSVVTIDCSRSICPTDYQILTYVHGQQLSAFQDPETQYIEPVLLQAIGAYVAQVHQVALAGFGPLGLASLQNPTGIHNSWQDYIFLRLQEHIDVCLNIDAISSHEALIIQKIFVEHAQIFECSSPVLLHGDLGNHNFLSQNGVSISALIDWEDCMSGDPVFDIAFWGTFFRDHMLKDFLIGYRQHTALPDDFELCYWLYFLRIALSKTVHRFRFGYQDHPGRPPASLRIQRALENVIRLQGG